MKNLIYLLTAGSIFILLGCNTSKSVLKNTEALDAIVDQRNFEINARFAQPLATNSMNSIAIAGLLAPGNTINQIDVSTSASYIRIVGDSVAARLPYYGERHMGAGYNNSRTGVQFNGIAKNLEINKSTSRHAGYEVKFSINDKTETYIVNARLFSDLSSAILINSSQRSSIRYRGAVAALDTNEIE